MYINKFLAKKIGIGIAVLAVPAVAIGGYFAISNSDKYRKYYATPTNDSPRGYIDAYKKAIYNGAEVIAAPGFTHKDPILNAFNGTDDFFKDTGFMLFDDTTIPFEGPLNKQATLHTWSVTFRSDLGSIQTGIAMAQFLNENRDIFGKDGELTYGMFGGLPFASVTSFMGGIQKGVQWFNENVARPNKDKFLEVKELVQKQGKYFSGSFSPSDGKDIIEDFISQKADVIIPVAGPQVWLAQKLIKTHKSNTILLGVDSAVEDDPQAEELPFKKPDGSIIGNGKYVQFSSEKNLARAAETALKIINNGNQVPESEKTDPRYENFADPNGLGGFGTIAVGNIENGCAGVSEAGKSYLKKALNGKQDPSTDQKYNTEAEMKWIAPDNSKTESYFLGLKQKFENLITNPEYNFTPDEKPIIKKDFIKKGVQSDDEKVKVILSGSTSILMDGSFSQSCYRGISNYYKSMDINVYYPKTAAYDLFLKKKRG